MTCGLATSCSVAAGFTGVVDWEDADLRGEPVRDLIRFAIAYALYLDRGTRPGRRVRGFPGLRASRWGAGIGFGINGSGWFPELFRGFVRDGLAGSVRHRSCGATRCWPVWQRWQPAPTTPDLPVPTSRCSGNCQRLSLDRGPEPGDDRNPEHASVGRSSGRGRTSGTRPVSAPTRTFTHTRLPLVTTAAAIAMLPLTEPRGPANLGRPMS